MNRYISDMHLGHANVVSVIFIPSINDTLQHTATENNSIFSVYEINQ